VIICFDKVSKRYNLRRDRPRSFRDAFVRGLRRSQREAGNSLWALREVSFDIRPGESVALVGPNGAGKSTALKLISRVIGPTAGRVTVGGRVAALLELGTGFHPELSGRDNVYLAGALAGMDQPEIARKYDAVVDFAEIASFMDVPVKHYSSGMFARLAFAVAVHLDPEVLLVDEVLAVGDHSFQRKCLDRIAEIQSQGVTICLVSHSADVVRSLCGRALWFDHGQLMADGSAEAVVLRYLSHETEAEAARMARLADDGQSDEGAAAGENASLRIRRVQLLDETGQPKAIYETGERLVIEIDYQALVPVEAPIFGIAIHRHDGLHVTGPNTAFAGLTLPTLVGTGTMRYVLPELPLLDGLYHLTVAIVNSDNSVILDYHDKRYPFRVLNQSAHAGDRYGLIQLAGTWQHLPAREAAVGNRLSEA
jgi:lipopolysaccharide transport system ATP-binding protein